MRFAGGTASTSFFQFQTALYWAKSRRATIYGTGQAQSPPARSPNKSLHNRHNARLRRPSRKRAAQRCHGDAAVVAHTLAPRPRRRDAGRRRRHRCAPARARRPIRFHEGNDGEQAKPPTARKSFVGSVTKHHRVSRCAMSTLLTRSLPSRARSVTKRLRRSICRQDTTTWRSTWQRGGT